MKATTSLSLLIQAYTLLLGIQYTLGPFFFVSHLFISISLLSIGIWIAVFVFYDRIATYEEKKLIEILGKEYVVYQKRIPKWFLRLHRS